jgi:RimJ/RimL family protein N-acetyltransferase
VRLRPPAEADAAWIAASVEDPEIPRWTRVPSPYTKDDAFAWVALAESMGRQGIAHHLVIAGAGDASRLGSVGLEVHETHGLYGGRPHGEIGYWLAADARGRGTATRAVRLIAGWALAALPLPALEIHVLPANAASHGVARRAGFKPTGTRLLPFHGRVEEFDVYALEGGGSVVGEGSRKPGEGSRKPGEGSGKPG